jgi:hypothetical protein
MDTIWIKKLLSQNKWIFLEPVRYSSVQFRTGSCYLNRILSWTGFLLNRNFLPEQNLLHEPDLTTERTLLMWNHRCKSERRFQSKLKQDKAEAESHNIQQQDESEPDLKLGTKEEEGTESIPTRKEWEKREANPV